MYDSITGGFSGSGAQQNAGSGGTAAGGGGGGGDGGSGGGGGGGTSSSGKTRSSRERSSSRGSQLVTSVTSRDVREKYEIERSQLGHGHYGVVRRCWDKETREVRGDGGGEGGGAETIKCKLRVFSSLFFFPRSIFS